MVDWRLAEQATLRAPTRTVTQAAGLGPWRNASLKVADRDTAIDSQFLLGAQADRRAALTGRPNAARCSAALLGAGLTAIEKRGALPQSLAPQGRGVGPSSDSIFD